MERDGQTEDVVGEVVQTGDGGEARLVCPRLVGAEDALLVASAQE